MIGVIKEYILNLSLAALVFVCGCHMHYLGGPAMYVDVITLSYSVSVYILDLVQRLELQALSETLLVGFSTLPFIILEKVIQILCMLPLSYLFIEALHTTVWVWHQVTAPLGRVFDFCWGSLRHVLSPAKLATD